MRAVTRGWVLGLAVAAGCGLSHEGGEDRGAVSGSSLEIPLEPRAAMDEWLRITPPDEWASHVMVDAATTMTFARGPRYPQTVEVRVAGFTFGRCSLEGTVSIRDVTGSGEGITASRAGAGSYRVTVLPGSPDRAIHVTGTLRVEDPSCPFGTEEAFLELDFDLSVEVRSREVHGVEVSPPFPCRSAEQMAFLTDTALYGMGYAPIDRDGRRFLPANATPERPVDLTLTTRDGSELSVGPERDLWSVRLPGAPTMVDIAGPAGPSTAVAVLDPAIVTEVEHVFHLDTWLAGRLEDGDLVDGAAFEEPFTRDRIYASYGEPQRLDGEPLCSIPSMALFELRSLTPEVCAASPYTGDDLTYLSGMQYAFAALDRDGACALEWSAPALNGGRGLGGRIEVTVVNADLLMDAE